MNDNPRIAAAVGHTADKLISDAIAEGLREGLTMDSPEMVARVRLARAAVEKRLRQRRLRQERALRKLHQGSAKK